MVSIHNANPNKSIEKIAQALKTIIKIPEWTLYVKTGPGKERMPVRNDWYLIRTASILRTIAIKGPIGVSKLKLKYGNKKNRGHKPGRFYKASGKIIRTILQQLEKAELVKQGKISVHKGRIITPKGQSLIDKNSVR